MLGGASQAHTVTSDQRNSCRVFHSESDKWSAHLPHLLDTWCHLAASLNCAWLPLTRTAPLRYENSEHF